MNETYESIMLEDIEAVKVLNDYGFNEDDYPSDSLSLEDMQALQLLQLLGFNEN